MYVDRIVRQPVHKMFLKVYTRHLALCTDADTRTSSSVQYYYYTTTLNCKCGECRLCEHIYEVGHVLRNYVHQ